MKWLMENWTWLLPMAIAALSIINRATVNWRDLEGEWYLRILPTILLVLIEVPSVLRSRGSQALTKAPFTIEGSGHLLIVLALSVGLVGCATWKTTTLKTTQTILGGASAMHSGLKVACKPTVKACRAEGKFDLKDCPELQECFDKRGVALVALDELARLTSLTLIAVDLGEEATAIKALTAALESYRLVVGGLQGLGVDVSKWRL